MSISGEFSACPPIHFTDGQSVIGIWMLTTPSRRATAKLSVLTSAFSTCSLDTSQVSRSILMFN